MTALERSTHVTYCPSRATAPTGATASIQTISATLPLPDPGIGASALLPGNPVLGGRRQPHVMRRGN